MQWIGVQLGVSKMSECCEWQMEEEHKIVGQSMHALEKQNAARKDCCSIRRGDQLHMHIISPGASSFPINHLMTNTLTFSLHKCSVYNKVWFNALIPSVFWHFG